MTKIEWTDRTWNPTTGCDRVSAGCDHCYAMGMAKRLKAMGAEKYQNDGDPLTSGPGFGVAVHEGSLTEPVRWRKPSMVFVNSMSDLFHNDIPDEFIAKVFAVMALADHHTFQVLTKRHGRMRALLSLRSFPELVTTWAWRISAGGAMCLPNGNDAYSPSAVAWPLPNVWLGVSAEDQKWAKVRIPVLLDTPAAVRFVSAEPLLGPLDLRMWLENDPEQFDVPPLDWVIVGGESGPKARPMHPDWARKLRDQCTSAGVPYLFKQWGEWVPNGSWRTDTGRPLESPREHAFTDGGRNGFLPLMARVGKKVAGRELDGRTWDEFPEVTA